MVFPIWKFTGVLTFVWNFGKGLKNQQIHYERKLISCPTFLSFLLPGLLIMLYTLLKGNLLPQVGPKSRHAVVIIIGMKL